MAGVESMRVAPNVQLSIKLPIQCALNLTYDPVAAPASAAAHSRSP
jgi:hypothetical protein